MWRLADLADAVGAELVGDGEVPIRGVATLENAGPDQIGFLANPRYRPQLATTRAGAVIVGPEDSAGATQPRLVIANPYACYARVALLLHPAPRPPAGIHPTAVIGVDASVDPSAAIGPHAVVGANARIGARSVVGAGCAVGAGSTLGEDTLLHDRVTVYHDCVVGSRCVIHSGVVIGADGFGMAWSGSAWIKIPQIGRVLIGDDVEIGANTTIDRGALDDTVIEEGVKLDNLIQIAHNVRIGAHTVIAGCTGISGSTHVGRHCRIGGGVGIVGHVEICDGTTISGFSLITKSVTEAGVYTSSIPSQPHRTWMRTLAALRGLPELNKALRRQLAGRGNTPEEDETS
jgi:UDP-3-O-[3-hydroxymyristoyl] glucosamine N-acyltransferase